MIEANTMRTISMLYRILSLSARERTRYQQMRSSR